MVLCTPCPMVEDQKNYARRQFFVKRDLQTRYALMFVLAIGFGLNMGVILTVLAPMIKNSSPAFPILYFVVVISCIVLVAAISILLTHRIAGPIYKIEKTFRQIINEKDLSLRVFLRTGDELQELAEEINRLLDSFRDSLIIESQKIDVLLAKLDLVIAQMEQQSQQTEPSYLVLTELRRILQETTLSYKLR